MIMIIDFGSQYTQLIARIIRKNKIFCQIELPNIPIKKIIEKSPNGIILSGGPNSVYKVESQKINLKIFEIKIPILGICYGMHFIIHSLGGKVKKSNKREYGSCEMFTTKIESIIFKEIQKKTLVWMSHKDSIEKIPAQFKTIGITSNKVIAAISDEEKKIYGLQFHPEVMHTTDGNKILQNFLLKICNCKQNWKINSFINIAIEDIRKTVKNKKVVLGLSGGIDSLVTAKLLENAIGNQLTCFVIDNGLLRHNEIKKLKTKLKNNLKSKIVFLDKSEKFIKSLISIIDPEEKRKIIGRLFIEIFEEEVCKIKNAKYIAQGTLYPDIIESNSSSGAETSLIKSHHNVGGIPKNIKFKLIEPLKWLFKDEVRKIAEKMNIENEMIWRHPFPGPGLAIRIIGEVTEKKLMILRNADTILEYEMKSSGYYKKVWQAFTVLLPIKSVGVMGDERTYDKTIAIRAVTSSDAMTADWAKLPYNLLSKISNRIINEVKGINRVMYDISSKPPSTIEME